MCNNKLDGSYTELWNPMIGIVNKDDAYLLLGS